MVAGASLDAWLGRTEVRDDLLDPARAAALAATLERDAPAPRPGDPLPPAWHWIYFWDCARNAELGPDGHPKRGGFLPPVPLPQRMWAGGRLVWQAPLRVGEPARRRSSIAQISPKTGRSGALVFVQVRHEIGQGGRVVLVEEQDIVYRDASSSPSAQAASERLPEAAPWRREVLPDPIVLFRYSALTFNSHLIHLDREYCRGEGYPGLVVHGPLLATWLLELLHREFPGRSPGQFSYRALRPLFEGTPVRLAGEPEGARVRLWAGAPDGTAAMAADAEL